MRRMNLRGPMRYEISRKRLKRTETPIEYAVADHNSFRCFYGLQPHDLHAEIIVLDRKNDCDVDKAANGYGPRERERAQPQTCRPLRDESFKGADARGNHEAKISCRKVDRSEMASHNIVRNARDSSAEEEHSQDLPVAFLSAGHRFAPLRGGSARIDTFFVAQMGLSATRHDGLGSS